MVKRIKCIISYDGTNFYGFQRQTKGRTIQGEIEKALRTMHKRPIDIHASGRTDAKVHALNQVFHFETTLEIKPENWKRALNTLLPPDIYIKAVEIMDNEFHARYFAKSKEYRYYLSMGEYNPLQANYINFYQKSKPLNVERMKEAIQYFIGTHDFRYFTSMNTNPNTIREIMEAEIIQTGPLLEFRFVGNGFLRYQIRVMVGTLIEIGEGKLPIETIPNLLNLKPGKAGRTAKPHGLYLVNVDYYQSIDEIPRKNKL